METYKSRYSAKDLDDTIGLVHGLVTPKIGENGNWFIGDQDTGVTATGSKPVTADSYMTQPVGVNEDKKLFTLSPGGGEFRLIATVDTGDTTVDGIIISQDDNGNPLQLEEAYILVESCTKPYAYAPMGINKQGVNWTPVGEDRAGKPACLYITKFQGLWACFCNVCGYGQYNPFNLYPYQYAAYRNYQLIKNAGNKIREIRLGYTACKCTIYGRD